MKRTTRLFPSSILIAVFMISACAPTVPSTTSAPESVPPTRAEAAAPTVPAATQPEVQPEATLAPTETPPQIIATSRGPDLEATDPTTVNLASGQLQLVEFFRFT